MDDIIKAIDEQLPRFNWFLLKTYPKQQVESTKDFLSITFDEAMKMLCGSVKYIGYRILSPEEVINYELGPQRSGVNIATSELQLIAYDFIYDDKKYTSHIYLPYLVDGSIIIKNTKYMPMFGIVEKMFSCTNNSVTERVIRYPLHFYRSGYFTLKSEVTGEYTNEWIISTKLHHRKSLKRNVQSTIIHYLLCKFGFINTLNKFGLSNEDVLFTDVINIEDTNLFDYFLAKKLTKNNNTPVYLKVKKILLDDPTYRKLFANITYLLTKWSNHDVERLYEPTNSIYHVYLGEILYSQEKEAMAHSQAETHMFSVDLFLDHITRNRLAAFGVHVNDIYDLLMYVFVQIDQLIISTSPQDLYNKRIDIIEQLMIKTFVSMIYTHVYQLYQNLKRLKDKEMSRLVRNIRVHGIRGLTKAPNIRMTSGIVNGNWLLTVGLQKIRLTGSSASVPSLNSTDARFHTSVAAVETLVGLSGKNPGITGTINPFIEISPEGGIIRPDYADDIDSLAEYLPFT